ncbi:MAG TPA: VTT domain-containing protein [Anaerolineaceae bacterium]|nr:VTT domain-containing protein [Anaerolineaceae bacterium]
MSKEKKITILRWLALIFVVGLTVVLFLNRENIQYLEQFGYLGIFLASLLTNASLILPVPGVLITSAMGAVFNPFYVALAAGGGATLGEITGYLAGFSGQTIIEKAKWHEKLESWMQKYGDWTILVMAFIPNPAFDVVGIMAGAMKIPIHRFLFFCFIGKVLKMLVFAYGGYLIGSQIDPSLK